MTYEKEKLSCCAEHNRQCLGSWGLHGRRSRVALGRKQVKSSQLWNWCEQHLTAWKSSVLKETWCFCSNALWKRRKGNQKGQRAQEEGILGRYRKEPQGARHFGAQRWVTAHQSGDSSRDCSLGHPWRTVAMEHGENEQGTAERNH